MLILVPDIGMLGYTFNAKIGAFSYNLLHNRIIAVAALLAGFYFNIDLITLTGVILFSHIAMDRMLGYGLKLQEGFKHTHLGKLN